MHLLRGFHLLLFSLFITFVSIPSDAQQPSAAMADVRLEPHDGKTAFYLGEPIQLDLVFENHTSSPTTLNTTIYGDVSEKVEITPATGWFQWQTQSGHDYATAEKLGDQPIRIPVRLDEGFIFREPGHYRVRVTTARLQGGSALGDPPLPAVTTNEVELELNTMPADVEAGILRGIRAALTNAADTRSGYKSRENAMARLAALQGDESLAEKIRLLKEGDDDFRSIYREAFASTRNLERQLALLEDAWTNPGVIPRYDTPDALTETRMLLTGRNLEGWHMMVIPRAPDPIQQKIAEEHHADMVALLDSMSKRSGEGRAVGAYFLIEFGGLTDTERTRAIEYAIEEFPHMDSTEQHMLLETARPPLRDMRLVPMLTSLLTLDPADKDAIASLAAIAPADATPWVLKTVCASAGVVLLDTFKDVHADRLPEVDACLAAQLRVVPATPRAEFEWKQRAVEAARFASPAILTALKEGWQKPAQDGAALAILLRDAPLEAVALLNKKLAAGRFDGQIFYESNSVFKQLNQPVPDGVIAWLRQRLATGDDREAGIAAYELSVIGEPSDTALIESRLQRLRNQWRGREQEVTTSAVTQPPGQARQAEVDMASALASYEARTKVDGDQRHDLGQGCMSDMCRFYLK
jgi:hypothetical protein